MLQAFPTLAWGTPGTQCLVWVPPLLDSRQGSVGSKHLRLHLHLHLHLPHLHPLPAETPSISSEDQACVCDRQAHTCTSHPAPYVA